jgi:excisionase family DNA binding protein
MRVLKSARMDTNIDTQQVIDRATDGLLSKKEVAARLRISPRTLDQWMRKKRIPFLKIGKTVRFRFSAVMRKLNQFEVNA